MPGVRVTPCQAAFYVILEVDVIADTLAFCKRLVTEAGVGLAPGAWPVRPKFLARARHGDAYFRPGSSSAICGNTAINTISVSVHNT